MHQSAKNIRNIVNNWFTHNNANCFHSYKDMKMQSIWDKLKPNNFDTPDKAFRLCHLMLAEKMAVEDLEEQKRIADKADLEQAKKGD